MDHLIPPALRKKLAMGANGANSSDIKETFKVQLSKDVDGNKTVNEYTILKTLGSGSYGKVKLCIDNDGKAFVRVSDYDAIIITIIIIPAAEY